MTKKSKREQSTIERGVSRRAGLKNAFRIQRFTDDHGFQVYALENRSEGRKIYVPRFVFGPFRACVRQVLREEIGKDKAEAFEHKVAFLSRDYFYLRSTQADLDNLIIQDLEEREGSSGYITVSRRSPGGAG